jgi:hypothetical protein
MTRERQRLLYILAPSYSGSTLLTYLLAWHPRIATIGELKATPMGDVERYRCSCGELITQCGFWREASALCAKRNVHFDVRDFNTVVHSESPLADRLLKAEVRGPWFEALRRLGIKLVPGARADLARQLERNRVLTGVIAELQNADIFLDGSKDATRLLHFVESGLFDVRVIHLQRDGRGVITSIAKHTGLPFMQAAERWAKDIQGLESMRKRLPPALVIDLKYEDLCRDPAATLARIFGWLGIDTATVAADDFKRGDFHLLGNAMRLNAVSEVRLDEKWRSLIEETDQRYFLRKFGVVHKRLGYA